MTNEKDDLDWVSGDWASEGDDASDVKAPAKKVEAVEAAKPAPVAKPSKAAKTAKAQIARDTTRIMLEESDLIPPTGLFVGLNGRGYLVKTGVEVDVPNGVLDILKNAVISTPQVNPDTQQVVGYRKKMRYPYSVVA